MMEEQAESFAKYCHLLEYDKLKDEQTKRIEYRDQMVHVHLALVGAAIAWGLTHPTHRYVLLAVPWMCLIIGWAYLINDERISAIGKYIRETLVASCSAFVGVSNAHIFQWENIHRCDDRRMERKILQLLVDEVEFVLSGFLSLGILLSFEQPLACQSWLVIVTEVSLLVVLAIQFARYADVSN